MGLVITLSLTRDSTVIFTHTCSCSIDASQTYLLFHVEKLNEKQGDRIRFFLSKADTAGQESDRQVCTGTL